MDEELKEAVESLQNWYQDKETLKSQIAEHIKQVLILLGEDVGRPGLQETPQRVAKMYLEVFKGYKDDVEKYIKVFPSECNEMVTVKDIEFYSFCEHHMLPFIGKMHIAYIPNGQVLGISKLVRISRVFSSRLQIQEELTTQIADTLMKHLNPKGVMVWVEAEHTCMTIRGVKSPGAKTVTTAVRGSFSDPTLDCRREFMEVIKHG